MIDIIDEFYDIEGNGDVVTMMMMMMMMMMMNIFKLS